MFASGSLVQDHRREETPQEEIIQEGGSKPWFPRSQLYYSSFTSDESIKQEEFSKFAKMFKQKRIRFNYSVEMVAIEMRCSKTTIFCFESLKLSLWSMRKWKPLLQNWLLLAAKSVHVLAAKPAEGNRLVSNRTSQSVAVPHASRQGESTKDVEVLEREKGLWRPWGPGYGSRLIRPRGLMEWKRKNLH